MADNDKETISRPIGKWYFKRMTMLGLLLIGFGCWFLYDAVIGYPKGSFKAVAHEAFEAGGKKEAWDDYAKDPERNFSRMELDDEQLEAIKESHLQGGSKRTWDDYLKAEKMDEKKAAAAGSTIAELKTAFEAGGAENPDWKGFLQSMNLGADGAGPDDRVNKLSNAFEDAAKTREWKLFAAENGYPSKPPHFHKSGDIFEQYVIGSLCALGGLFVLLLMVLNRKRAVTADQEAYYPKPSVKVPFADVFRIDTRKWRRKGLAYAFYRQGGAGENKAIIDDLKFPDSQAILDRMLDNFEGELIEEVVDDEDEIEEPEQAEATPSNGSDEEQNEMADEAKEEAEEKG